MCGICGKISLDINSNVNEDLIRRMCSVLKHRGPDDEGVYISSQLKVGLGHRRLSIIDLSTAGHQPMSNEDGSIWIIFNGEIYNFLELKKQLEGKGHIFKSHTDTEVILHLYEDKGADCVRDLRGMFAFVIWDEKAKRAFIARDRVGKKPFYYFYKNRTLVFGSEIKAILQDPEVSREVNRAAITDYLSYGYTPTPETMFKGIMKLPPAHMMIYERGELKIHKYWMLDFSKKVKLTEQEYCDRAMNLLEESTRLRLISDVPLGAFLSGGIDSSAVVYMMRKINSGPIKTFSIGFQEESHNELKYARLVANRFETEHHEYIVKPEKIELLPKLVWYYNEPYADSSALPTYYVAKMTRQEVVVALNGDGGDENFGGYDRYMAVRYAELYKKIPRGLRDKIINPVITAMPAVFGYSNFIAKLQRFMFKAALPFNERHYNWINLFRDNEKDTLFTDEFKKELGAKSSLSYFNSVFAECNWADMVDSVMAVDIKTYLLDDLLVKMDIAAMANSLEGRSPFLDHKVMEFAASIPASVKIKGRRLKYILKKALAGILPDQILTRRKMGFGIPIDKWFRGELKDYAYGILMDRKSIGRNYFKRESIRKLLDDHCACRVNNGARIWALLNLELWHRIFIDGENL